MVCLEPITSALPSPHPEPCFPAALHGWPLEPPGLEPRSFRWRTEPTAYDPMRNFCLVQAISSPEKWGILWHWRSLSIRNFSPFILEKCALVTQASKWCLYSSMIFLVVTKSWCLGEVGIESYILAVLMKTSRHIANYSRSWKWVKTHLISTEEKAFVCSSCPFPVLHWIDWELFVWKSKTNFLNIWVYIP